MNPSILTFTFERTNDQHDEMLSEVLVGIFGALLAASLAVVSLAIVKTQLAYRSFKSKSRGLPMADDHRLISGHLISLAFKKDLNNHLGDLFAKHGQTFGAMYVVKPFVLTTDLDLIKKIVIDEQYTNLDRTSLNIPMKELELDCLMTAGGEQGRRIRKAIAPALRKSKFMTPNVSKEINDSIDKLIESFEKKLNEAGKENSIEVDVDDYFHRYSLNLTLSCLFKQNNLIDFHAKQDQWTHILDVGFKEMFANQFFYLPVLFPSLVPLADWLLLNYFELGVLRASMMNFIKLQTKLRLEARKQIEKLKETNKDNINEDNLILKDGTKFNRNMIDDVIDHYHEGKLTKREYFHSAFFMFGAADRTSADALSETLYQLALNVDKQDKLRESIRLYGPESQYLEWVLNESLRLRPPAAIGCSRGVSRDTEVSEEPRGPIIPKGSFVVTPAYVIHRLKKYWGEDVDAFRPERFEQQKSFHQCQFIPFGAGLRQCPGKEFAMHEMRLLVSKLVARYEFTCEKKHTEAYDAPFFIFSLPHQATIIRVSRVSQ